MNFSTIIHHFLRGRYFPLIWLAGMYLAISTLTRLFLFATNLADLDSPVTTLLAIIPIGIFYDIVTSFYLFALYALYLLLLPDRIHRSNLHRGFLMAASFVVLFGLLYMGPVEYFFFDEFQARFNFVAVGYLIYPHEVFINIWESYPVARVLLAIFAVTVALYWRMHHPLKASLQVQSHFRERLQPFVVFISGLLLVVYVVNINTGNYSVNRVANELAHNGIYSFFYALFHNELDYNKYYVTLPPDEAVARARKMVAQPNATFLPDQPNPLARHIAYAGKPKLLNVVLLVQESLGADFVGAYGDQRGLTPNIDRLARDSLVFANMYATGTRTVRGLEAISSSFPPIPGESIVKRPHNDGIFTWGQVMGKHGYTSTFLYGGYGSFDGMNTFFGGNGFGVNDRGDIDNPKFTNIWGVSDEDLMHHAITVFDQQHARGERIFALIMSTSNHKPFTYPPGIPGILAEGGGRLDGVKYADYAIGKFFEEIKSKPYFDDTVFVIVGDHGARVYGREAIPMRTYELPLVIYSPKHIKPRVVEALGSQIDIAPTVLGLLNISYDSVFFGRDLLLGDAREQYALVSHNRDVALFQHGELIQLGIRKASNTFLYDKKTNVQTIATQDEEQVKNAVSIFQLGYNLFVDGKYQLKD